MSAGGFMISVKGISKRYRLGQIGATTFNDALKRVWQRCRGHNLHDRQGPVAGNPRRTNQEDLWALRDVSFDVRQGEVVGIIGRNGAGKSTLLKILTRITEPTSGQAVLRGRVSSLLEVGTGFHPELTGRENTFLNGAILGMTKREIARKFDEIVAFSEVERFIDTPVKRYSSGMYVRLAFAVAAHLEPEILLVDEVLAVGDLGFQRKCLGKMEQVAKRGRTVLFVSHNMAAIQALCSRAILLENGRLTHDGRPDEAIGAYVSSVQKSMAEASLEARSDREGGTAFRFRSVVFRDAETGAPLNIVVSGRPVAIDVGYVSLTSVPLSEVVVAISFSNASGAFLSGCRSDAVGKSFRISPGPGQVVCRIPKFPFSQGRFNYHLIAYQQGTIVDWVRDAGYIDVTAGDYYGTGRIPAGALQSVFIDFDWRTAGAG